MGSTPTPSMEAYSSFTDSAELPRSSGRYNTVAGTSENSDSEASLSINSAKCVAAESNTNDEPDQGPQTAKSTSQPCSSIKSIGITSLGENSLPESIASKYLLGKVGEDEMKMYVTSMFPTTVSNSLQPKEVQQLQQLIVDHHAYKNQVMIMNTKLENLVKIIEEANKQTQSKHQQEIDQLRKENDALKQELESRIEAIKLSEEMLQKDQFELVQKVSEGKSVMSNISAHLEKLDLQQHNISLLNLNDGALNVVLDDNTIMKIKSLEFKLSEIKAENLELKDMQKVYIDEINCLKVNLTAAEELLKKAQVDINTLKCKDVEKNELFSQYEEEKKKMKHDLELFKQQLEVYRSDFEIERTAREELAGQKDQLLTDLKLLQRRNQQLIEENEKRFQNVSSPLPSSSATAPPPPRDVLTSNNYVCPICNKIFKTLGPLELHVQNCY